MHRLIAARLALAPALSLAVFLALATTSGAALPASVAAAPDVSRPDGVRATLAGDWVLDVEASDAGRTRLEREVRDVAGDLRPRGRHNPNLSDGRVPPERLGAELLREVHLPARTLNLAVAPDAVRFTRDGAAVEELATDGRPSVVDAANPGVRTAAWEAGELWVERTTNHGTRVVERWYRTPQHLVGAYEVRNGLFEDPISFELRFLPPGDRAAP